MPNITQQHKGFLITRDDGRWLVSHEDGSHWFEKIDASGTTVEDKACFYRRNANNRVLLEMHKDGHFRQYFYDEWDNAIALWRPLSYNSGLYTGAVYRYEYSQQSDGSVYGDRLDSREYNDYWLWLSKVPDTFEVKEYAAPSKVVKKKKPLFSFNPYNNQYREFNIHGAPIDTYEVTPASHIHDAYYTYPDGAAQRAISRGAIDEAYERLSRLASRRSPLAGWVHLDDPL